MICFEMRINGKYVATGSVDDDGVMSADVTWVTPNPTRPRPQELRARLGGILNEAHVTWVEQDLQVGDEVTIRIVEADRRDDPIRSYRDNPAAGKESRRRLYEQLKREFERPRNG